MFSIIGLVRDIPAYSSCESLALWAPSPSKLQAKFSCRPSAFILVRDTRDMYSVHRRVLDPRQRHFQCSSLHESCPESRVSLFGTLAMLQSRKMPRRNSFLMRCPIDGLTFVRTRTDSKYYSFRSVKVENWRARWPRTTNADTYMNFSRDM